jgi:hypothetical protein
MTRRLSTLAGTWEQTFQRPITNQTCPMGSVSMSGYGQQFEPFAPNLTYQKLGSLSEAEPWIISVCIPPDRTCDQEVLPPSLRDRPTSQ